MTESRTSLCAKYGVIRRRIETLKRNLLQDERELARIGEQIHSFVSLDGAIAHDNMVFCLDPADRKLMAVPYRLAADLDHPDGPDLKDPLGVIEAARQRLFADSRPAVDPLDVPERTPDRLSYGGGPVVDPLDAHEAARDRLTQPKPVVEPMPEVDDDLTESAHFFEVGHRAPSPRLVGHD